jgi:hypothetical protein
MYILAAAHERETDLPADAWMWAMESEILSIDDSNPQYIFKETQRTFDFVSDDMRYDDDDSGFQSRLKTILSVIHASYSEITLRQNGPHVFLHSPPRKKCDTHNDC